jgi:hypothetical protein
MGLLNTVCITPSAAQFQAKDKKDKTKKKKTVDADALFDAYANGKPAVAITDLPARLQAPAAQFAMDNAITNGQLTRAQFVSFYDQTVGWGGTLLKGTVISLVVPNAAFVGKVVATEPIDIEAKNANGQTITYRIVVVEVSDLIVGLDKETKRVRVGYPLGQGTPPGEKVTCLFKVNEHADEKFYVANANQTPHIISTNAKFATDVKACKQSMDVLANPIGALKAEKKQDRYMAAAILVANYRNPVNPTGAPVKSVKIGVEESELILKAIADGNWTAKTTGFGTKTANAVVTPGELFGQLGITEADGFDSAKLTTVADRNAAMKTWLEENAGKYSINKLVIDAK